MLRRRMCTTCHVSIVISIILFYSHPKTQHVVTCCERLHTSANIAQQETTMLAQQCCVLLRAFARAFTWFYIFSAILQINFSLFLLFQCCVCSVVSVSHHPYKKVSGTFLLLKSYSENTQNIELLSPAGRITPVHLSISPVLPSI